MTKKERQKAIKEEMEKKSKPNKKPPVQKKKNPVK
jgi:hypothetical protein